MKIFVPTYNKYMAAYWHTIMELGTINLADNIGALGCVLLVPHSNFLSLRYSEDIFAVHNTHHPGCKPDASEPKALVKQVIICSNSGRFWAAATR